MTGERAVAATRFAAGLFALVVVWLFWLTLPAWGIAHDAGNLLYVAWLIHGGAVPYRDVFEINWPGTILAHRAAFALGADTDLGWRLVDLAMVAAACGMIMRLALPAGRLAAAVAGLVAAAGHLTAGSWNLAQRDQMIALLVLAATLAARAGRGAGVGLALGLAATIKPVALAYLAALWLARAGGRGRQLFVAALVAAAVLAAAFVQLFAEGGLDAFFAAQRFAIAAYAEAGRRPPEWLFRDIVAAGKWLSPVLPLAIVGAIAAPAGGDASRRAALVLLAYGLFHFVVQTKGWLYHAYPLLYGFSLAAGLGAARLLELPGLARWAPASLLAAATIMCGLGIPPRARAPAETITPAVIADLRPLLRPGDRVQPIDATYGVNDALRRLGVRPPTRFLYDFVFFPAPEAAEGGRRLRAEFLAALAASPPRAIVVSNQQWPLNYGGYSRLREWPEFVDHLARDYVLAVERTVVYDWGYRIYLRRD